MNIELLSEPPQNDPDHMIRALNYNTILMNSNPLRPFAITAVTDMQQVVFFRSSRSLSAEIEHQYSAPLSLSGDGVGWMILMEILQDPFWQGFCLPDVRIQSTSVALTGYLGSGV